MTAGQRLIEQGRQEGIEQGFQQGMQQGMQGALLLLLRQRFGAAVNRQVEQRVMAASRDQVEAWTGRVLSAASLAEVIAE